MKRFILGISSEIDFEITEIGLILGLDIRTTLTGVDNISSFKIYEPNSTNTRLISSNWFLISLKIGWNIASLSTTF